MSASGQKVGRAWVYGDHIDTDVLAPGIYIAGGIEELAKHCLEAVDPTFAPGVEAGDVLIAGTNFGAGSSREQAVEALKHLGIVAVVAHSFAGIFYRNAFNHGLPALVCPDATAIQPGHRVSVDVHNARLHNHSEDRSFDCEPVSPHLLALINAGGLVPHLEGRLAAARRGEVR